MISENKDNILEKIIEVLTLEDINTQILNYNNPFIIYFKDRRYCIASFNIRHSGGKTHHSNARRIQIKGTLKEIFLENGSENICCAILGFDKKTDTFSTWEIYKNLYSDVKNWSRSKSLYTDYNIIKQASEFGASVTPENLQIGDDSAAISFKTNFLANYLSKPKEKKIQYNKGDDYILCLDHLHNRKNAITFINKLTNLNSSIFPQTKVRAKVKNKRENRWSLEEYILVFELYLKMKNDGTTDNINNDEYKKVYEIFKKISSINNSTPRTINALSYRVGNFKYNDPEWDKSKGLSGAEDDEILNFVLNKYAKDRKSLLKEIDKIIAKYFIEDNNINYRPYSRDPNNLKQEIDISIENIFDPIEIQNLIDKKKKLHENIVHILANKLKKNNFAVYEDPKGFDLYALNSDNQKAYLFEIKTITDENFVSQTRSAIIQLQEYLYFNKHHNKDKIFKINVEKIIVFSENPTKFRNYKKYVKYFSLLQNLDIGLLYLYKNDIIFNNKKSFFSHVKR